MAALQFGVQHEPQHPGFTLEKACRLAYRDDTNIILFQVGKDFHEARFFAHQKDVRTCVGNQISDIGLGTVGETERGRFDPDQIDDLNIGLKISAKHCG
jgi:hypothetical protein